MIPAPLRVALHELIDHLADDCDTLGEVAGELERVRDENEERLDALAAGLVGERERRHRGDAELRDELHELDLRHRLLVEHVAGLGRTPDARTEAAA